MSAREPMTRDYGWYTEDSNGLITFPGTVDPSWATGDGADFARHAIDPDPPRCWSCGHPFGAGCECTHDDCDSAEAGSDAG